MTVKVAGSLTVAAVEWGPLGVWAGAGATFLAAAVALAAAAGSLERRRRPRLALSFAARQPWMRTVVTAGGSEVLWVRGAVDNHGSTPARGCTGRLLAVSAAGNPRADVDPVQLRWTGMPRALSFHPLDIRPGQREFLNVCFRLPVAHAWRIDTFDSDDFDPGFSTDLVDHAGLELRIALFVDNSEPTTLVLAVSPGGRLSARRDG
ncbi:hypothetical protein [Streptomyces omiyaensis]|uniref:hypothetical protein n=1 Tax=Streptomyces omiyaensis TaxID=68247 RepID=UPI003702599F